MSERRDTGRYESIQHFSNFPAKVFVTSIRSSAYHWHYDYELIGVLKGRVDVLYGIYGPEPQPLDAGDIILINPKDVHGLRGIDPDNVCLCVQFSPSLLEPVPAGMNYYFFLNSADERHRPKLPMTDYMHDISRIALANRREDTDAYLRKNAWLYMLLADLVKGAQYELQSASLNNEQDMKLVMSISGYIDRNLSSENLAGSICKEFGLSEKGVYLLLKNVMGLTLKELIDIARLEQACSLLQDTSISLQAISDRCGYSGEATFYRRFKSAMGVTPGEYRKGLKANTIGQDVQDYLSYDEYGVGVLLDQWAEK